MRQPGVLEPFAKPGTNPDYDETNLSAADVAAQIVSPMKSLAGNTVRLDNAHTQTLPAPFVTNDLDTDTYNGFIVPKLSAALTIPVPKAPAVGSFEGRKITLQITSRGTAGDTITWTGGAGGWLWPGSSGIGPLKADFDSVLAAMANNDVILVGAQYHTVKDRWLINAVAGPFT